MGMDVNGKNPTKEVGEYFRNNVWYWHPLWDFCCHVAPQITGKVQHAHSNDGDGLDEEDSRALAKILRASIKDGSARKYKLARKSELDSLPDEKCDICQGTGERHDSIVDGKCNACQGKGSVRPWATHYYFTIENVKDFAAFLENCGGFEIC